MSTVNPVQKGTYTLSTSNNPITFGSGTSIQGGGVYGGPGVSWNVTNMGDIDQGGYGGAADGLVGIFLDGSGSTVTNAGAIGGYYFGVELKASGTVTNESGGTIICKNP